MPKRTQTLVLVIVALGFAVSCSSDRTAMKDTHQAISVTPQKPAEYLIQSGDKLEIKFFYNPELNEAVTVRPDGKIALQLVDEVQAAGVTPAQLDKILTKEYSRELRKPKITVLVRSFTNQRIYVGGEVNNQGLIDLESGMTALQAVLNAGGFKETAKPEGAIIIRKGSDNRPVPIQVDLENVLYGKNPTAYLLQPYDIVYIPKSSIAEANKFVEQYIEKLLMFKGWNFGLWYGFGPKYEGN